MNLVAVLGLAGSGKNTVADVIARLTGGSCIALADPLKRFCKEVFDFSDEQLYGPSEYRNAIDLRYRRNDGSYLSPRIALQLLGTEWGRSCYEDIWVDLSIRRAKYLLSTTCPMVVITDCRYVNEARKIKAAGGKVWRIIRGSGAGISPGVVGHTSETEQLEPGILNYVDVTINNDGTTEELTAAVRGLLFSS